MLFLLLSLAAVPGAEAYLGSRHTGFHVRELGFTVSVGAVAHSREFVHTLQQAKTFCFDTDIKQTAEARTTCIGI